MDTFNLPIALTLLFTYDSLDLENLARSALFNL